MLKYLKQIYGVTIGSGSLSARGGTEKSAQPSGTLSQSITSSQREATLKLNVPTATSRDSLSRASPSPSAVAEDPCLFMMNTRAANAFLSIRKLAPQDQLLKTYFKAIEAFRRDGNDERFKLLYAKPSEVEKYLKPKCSFSHQSFDDQN
jgi:hypothetical protein